MHKNLKDSRVVILGGTGFIGKAAVRAFLKQTPHVLSIGRTQYDARDASTQNLERLAGIIKDKDILINLLTVVNSHALTATEESQEVNVEFPRRLMETVRMHNPHAHVIFSSSQTVYGSNFSHPIDENYPREPETVYAKQKKEAEDIFMEYAKKYAIPLTILRLTNVYGADALPQRSVISLFFKKAIANEDMTLFGEGNDRRDYLFVEDAAQAFIVAAALPLKDLIYNVGSEEFFSLKEVANLITGIVGKGTITHQPFPADYARYPGNIELDCSRFRRETGWKAETTLLQGLQEMYRVFKI